ncbi:hypothetical protein PMZ80_010239 [Knufia obscura]|uniref:rRNA methyltransferase 1, mitochondrial n=2 Tax=Knufia TaxID=430999 RepID=A0AAN8EV98_9EURO|nr:hypothetical protein PMZ80_010239 [Knufia obscura]KAK5952978.1 hypothetical protein OHC33_006099 [Knufia fluminis]
MLSLRSTALCCSNIISRNAVSTSTIWSRHASLTGAISGGVRKAANALKSAEDRRRREGQLGFWEQKNPEKRAEAQENARKHRVRAFEREKDLQWLASNKTLPAPSQGKSSERLHDGPTKPRRQTREAIPDEKDLQLAKKARARAIGLGRLVDAPQSMPYSEAASEFVYGTFAVLAALQARRRKFYKLYIWCGEDGLLNESDNEVSEVVRAANAAKVRIVNVAGNWLKMLDKMSDKRPHNGLVLEAAAIPKIFAKSLEKVESTTSPLAARKNYMTPAELEVFDLQSSANIIPLPTRPSRGKRYPFLLWLDRVTDTGNMGAIFRSAYFFGADAIIVPTHGTAPLNPIAVKNSAGAAEHIPVIHVDDEREFMKQSQDNGWLFFAAVSESSASTLRKAKDKLLDEEEDTQASKVLKYRPAVLMMGNEGEGLRPHMQKQADRTVSISGAGADKLVDSLNVSVAAALLAQRFLSPYTS